MFWNNWGYPMWCCSNNDNGANWIWIIIIVFILLFLFKDRDFDNHHC